MFSSPGGQYSFGVMILLFLILPSCVTPVANLFFPVSGLLLLLLVATCSPQSLQVCVTILNRTFFLR